jgi:glycosyltransferase involved in cell wall biosynthesis
VCVGQADARWLRWIGGRDTVHIVPNGVDIPPLDSIPAEAGEPTLSFTGALSYQPNIEAAVFAARAIWPRIRAAVPTARFIIAGRRPTPEILALDGRFNIEIKADLPDMVPILGRSWVCIAPMRSGVGIKNKVLEAWACARPVVMSPLATNGLIVPAEHAGLVGASAEATARSVIALFNDADRRRKLGESARRNVEANFTWAGAAARIDALLRS